METRWSDPFLNKMREEADPLADKVVAEIIDSHGLGTYNNLIRDLVNNRDTIPASLPPAARKFFEDTVHLPTWADSALIRRGENLFALYGPEILSMLSFASLPTTYALKREADLLSITAQLTGHVHRRIFRTAQFILDVMQPGGLSSEGKGIRSIQKVRLIHASIRHRIQNIPLWQERWNDEWGLPINQEDLAKTMLSFSVTILQGIQKIGIRLKAEDAEAYNHAWCVVGYIMGIAPEIQPKDLADAKELSDAIAKHQNGQSPAGELLAQDLLKFQQRFMPGPQRLPAACLRYFSGNEIADLLNIPQYDWTVTLVYVQVGLMNVMARFPGLLPARLKIFFRYLTWNLIYKFVLYEEGGKFYFEIPESLRTRWHMPGQTA